MSAWGIRRVSAALAVLVAAGLALVAVPLEHGTLDGAAPVTTVTAPPPPPAPVPLSADEVTARVSPTIVMLTAQSSLATTAGTGIVVRPDGADTLVLTNHHVIDGGTDITATSIPDRVTYPVEVLGYDSSRDLAVLRLPGGAALPTATVAAEPARIGAPVTAVGNADGGGVPAAAPGTVTRVGVTITTRNTADGSRNQLSNLIQVDANVRPGDSGGPLVDTFGEIVGVNSAGNAVEPGVDAAPAPMSYAIPIEGALQLVDEVLSGRAAPTVHIGPTPALGVSVRDRRGATLGDGAGVEVIHVGYRGPAESAGLVRGDVITGFGGAPIRSSSDLTIAMNARHPGDRVDVQWTDATGAARTGTLVLQEGPPR
ncbi:S1C family serine protease [Prescottella subtropica]|uniref:S1C family serine protease n=1 Tax=Prescottella subtropica TaxID=2545757 RepID=UPI0010F5C230|nr:trypsin-like peptidase domain-containing protein [Prescottella subtropica]